MAEIVQGDSGNLVREMQSRMVSERKSGKRSVCDYSEQILHCKWPSIEKSVVVAYLYFLNMIYLKVLK